MTSFWHLPCSFHHSCSPLLLLTFSRSISGQLLDWSSRAYPHGPTSKRSPYVVVSVFSLYVDALFCCHLPLSYAIGIMSFGLIVPQCLMVNSPVTHPHVPALQSANRRTCLLFSRSCRRIQPSFWPTYCAHYSSTLSLSEFVLISFNRPLCYNAPLSGPYQVL